MNFLSFQDYPIWLNIVIFSVAAAGIWFAGVRLERYTDAVSERTQLGKAFLGLILLAVVTDLPEVATTTTAMLAGNRELALHNLFGSLITQTAVLAAVDIFVSKGPLTRLSPDFSLLIQGVGLTLVVSAALVGIHIDIGLSSVIDVNRGFLLVGFGPITAFAAYLFIIYMTYRHRSHPRWLPAEVASIPDHSAAEKQENYLEKLQKNGNNGPDEEQGKRKPDIEQIKNKSWNQLIVAFIGFALIILAAGWLVTRVGEAVAEQTGLGGSFIGITLLSIATSLPEITTASSAVRNGNYSLAYSNIFGSNAFDIALLLPAALVYQDVLFRDVPTSIIFAAGLGIVMTCVFIMGLLERRDFTIFRMGWDSVVVLVLYLIGIVVFYLLR